jgi:hypothetical protein
MRNSKIRQITLPIILITAQAITTLIPAQGVVTPPLTKCHIELDSPHISKYLVRKFGIMAVKVNAYSKCDKPMRDLKLTVELYKVGFFDDDQVAKEEITVPGLIYANRVVKNQAAYVKCKNSKKSRFYGIAYASGVIDGQFKKTLHVFSEKTVPIKCGT